ncbi:MAG: Hyalin [Actinomycetia bacterium]|nr:Hyalin [Actinomycetes bacterium]
MQLRSRLARALGAALLLTGVVAGAATSASAASGAPVLAAEGPVRSFTSAGTFVTWGQGFRPPTNMTVASVALLQTNQPYTPGKVALDILTPSGTVLATGSGQTVPDGAYGGYNFSRLNLDAPVALTGGTSYVLRIRGIAGAQMGIGAISDVLPNGSMFNYYDSTFNYQYVNLDFGLRMYAEPAVVAPTITVPADQTVEANTTAGATTSLSVSASQGGTPITPVCSPALNSRFPLGTTTVSCVATAPSGTTASKSFKVTVRDTSAPVLALHDITAEATSSGGANVSYTASATDVADPAPAVNCSAPSGSTFGLGTTTVSCTARDASGNTSAPSSFHVVVADTTAPVLVLGDVVAEASSGAGAAVGYAVSATDVVDPSPSVSCDRAAGSTFGLGATKVSCTATDHSGNSSTGSFTVTVADTTAPVLVLGDVVAEASSGAGAAVGYAVSATDGVDASPSVSCDRAAGSTFALGASTVTCTATDHSGNTSTGSFTVTVADTTAPVFGSLADQTVDAATSAGSSVTFTADAHDAVDVAVVATCSPASGTTFGIGTTSVVCTATDHAGNTAATGFTVTVRGAAEQLQALAAAVTGVGPGGSFTSKVQGIQALVAAGDRAGARAALKAFSNEVKAQSGKKLSAATAAALLADAERISTILA